MFKSIALVSLFVSVCGFSQGWQKVDNVGKVSGNKQCKWWDTVEDKVYDESEGQSVGKILAGSTISICSLGTKNTITGDPVQYINNLNEEVEMRFVFAEWTGKCDSDRVYLNRWTTVSANSDATTDVYGNGPLNKTIGEKYCFKLETR